MPIFFSPSEVVQMGVQIEENGRDFYNAVAKSSKDDKAKEVFNFLAREETRHIEDFKKLLSTVEKYEPPEVYPGEYFAYLKALADEHVFTQKNKGEEVAGKVKSDKEAIELAIGFEKDSILLYIQMKDMVPDNGKKVVDNLIDQEKNHLRRLSELKKNFI